MDSASIFRYCVIAVTASGAAVIVAFAPGCKMENTSLTDAQMQCAIIQDYTTAMSCLQQLQLP
jgi:hypothetical protein